MYSSAFPIEDVVSWICILDIHAWMSAPGGRAIWPSFTKKVHCAVEAVSPVGKSSSLINFKRIDYIQGFEKSQFNISVLYICIYCNKQSVLKFAWLVLATNFSSLESRWHYHYFFKGPFLKCFLAINYVSEMWKHIYSPRADSALARSNVINSAFHEIVGCCVSVSVIVSIFLRSL